MWSVRLTLLLQAFAHELAELALVRPFASNQEIQEIESAFSLWNAVSPCGDKALAEVDIFLVYSRRLDENPVASIAAANVQNSFRARSEPWHRCFREFHIEAANLTAAEDIYDSRGYAVRKDWVNGPNKVFRFILQSFLEKSFVSDYEAFFFMEFDSTPLRPFWLDQFYAEVFQYPRAAIRGSRYRGDSWDNFLHHIPNSLLYHMNGNAIYFLRHPWLRFLAQKLEEEAASENGSIAFDVRMAQLTLEAPTRSDLQTAWTQNVPEGENPYQDDSLLVGNYANTLLNDSFEPPEFVRHGALANILENLDNSLVTLAVQAFHQANATLLMESLSESDFGEVVVVSSVDFAPPGTGPSLRVVPATLPEHMALCDLAAAVHTEYLLFTDTYHFIPGPTHVLVNGSRPVLPYIPASSMFCTAYPECTTSLDQAENFYGVKLNYHHNKYETLFQTLLAREFCQSWSLAAAALGSFDSCDYQHGPTADDYIAWLISMDKPFDYMPKNKERVGWRQWSMLWNVHPPDQRGCSIYTESDALKRKQSIKECSLYIQDGDACNADENCTFRAIFEAGKCMSTSEFHLLPATMGARTSTWTISTSSTASATSTLSSSTGSKTLTSSWTTLTATSMSTSTTRSTVYPGTSSTTVFASSTRTQSTQPTIILPAFCNEDGLPIVGVDVSNCIGRSAGESCSVLCAGSFEGDPATFVCGNDGTFTGEIQCQESTCAVETLPDGFETDCEQTPPGGSCFVRCPQGYQPAQAMYICTTNAEFLGVPPTCELQLCGPVGLPETVGVDTLACVEGIQSGQSCEVGCSYGFEGDSSTYRCVQGVFEGAPPTCQRKACEAPSEEISFSSFCGALLHGQSCLSSCKPGFMGAATQLQCENGILKGLPPVCIGSLCSLEGIVIGTGLDTSDCLGKRTSESCTLKCQRGYTPVGQPNLTCQSNRRFRSEGFQCLPKPCGDLSAVPSFASSAVGNSCSGLAFGQVCAAFCEIGWQIQGNASVIVCDDSGDASQGFAQYFTENRSYLPAERTQPPRCVASECTEGLPNMKGVSHDCEGKTTYETCQVNAQLGYFADRPSTLTCQADGRFQGDLPVIRPQTCPSFSFSPGVGSTCHNATLGMECWAYCESGWIGSPRRYDCKLNATGQLQLEALESITCTISGNGNGRRLAQSCADANADVRLLSRSFLHSCASLQDGDVCVVHCSSGFTMLEAEPALLSCQDGQFVGGPLPSCSPRSCDFAFPTGIGVQHDCNGRKTGENCTAQCGEEFTYTFGGAETFTCTSSGNFLGTNPSCERKLCEDLQLPELYTHNCREKRSGDTCGVTCALGYYFASWGSQFLCNGTFQGTLPSCQPNPCTDVPALGEVLSGNCEGLTTGESCELSCGAGFSPNSSRLTCDESGAFLGAYPLCNPANCPGSFALDHESIAHNCEAVPFGRSCNVYCALGYDLLDQTASLWSCQLNGSQLMLEGVLPLCEPARCWLGLPVSLQSYTDNCSGLAFKESCTLQCAMGYTAHGDHRAHGPASIGSDGGSSISSTYRCDSNGVAQTDNTRPNCTLQTCISNLTLPGVLTTCEDVQLNGTCFAFCAPGYHLKGSAQRWHCDASDLPAIDAAAVFDGIGLRGFLPVCLLETCSYNIPWSFRFSHNCHNVTTWSSCEVECADPFVGGQTSLQCQPNGALAGQLPECNEVTFTSTSTSTSAFTQTATTTFILLISTNLTLFVTDADALIAHPGSKGGFARALAQIFQLQPEQAELIDVELQVDSENLLVIAEVRSTYELRSVLDRLTLDEVNIIVNNYVATAIDNSSQETLTVLSMEIEVLDGNQTRAWRLQKAAGNPVMASTPWILFLAASCVLLVCCCSCVIRRQCRKSHAETRQDQRQNDGHFPAKDFGSELDKPRSMTDAGLVDAGIYLEEEGLDQDNEEVRLRLEDVGVFYEEGDCSESLSMQPEAGAATQAPQEPSASASVLLPQPRSGLGVLRHAKDIGSELEKPWSIADAGLVDAGIYLEEEGMDNDKAVSDAASQESDKDGLHL